MGVGVMRQVIVREGYGGARSPKKVALLDFSCMSLFQQAARTDPVFGFETAAVILQAVARFTHV